ncbi:7,8-didemethyl-8-hydroxy-5-deazariboflavin synthase subunit CofG [Nodosilinea sp. LEGE 06152]|uniref:7,8-didemethyl-8-hydroxy-5-deazariboflavin synthase subunit CofG n=1 Tax=Nodosilinea sp. LEGE 06152 TaxID=2777966 RepID=UPI0018817F3F|nr:7,8-didemethyl-8-hydroxy-5-deazariboflavin synthase subunit CofG [Nodosilinea sp. LEGE 06152]MBE9158432.1 7,8-didemethyl-8-hydroxy-5-deazariboflavin synthase subunit CofG [Nodosilinea sp. LEGE 06152]
MEQATGVEEDSSQRSAIVQPPRLVTYSFAHTLVPTYECFNRCTYCNFRAEPGRSPWLSLSDLAQQLPLLRQRGVCEVLVLSGEVAPGSPRRADWLHHIRQICELALEAGLLPHTNAGPLNRAEMAQLREVNVSMGLMVEQVTPKLLETVHRHAPSKRPEVRLNQLIQAGELSIPFTTGLLLGLGETEADWVESLGAIATIHHHYGHIQEVILQPHSPGQRQLQPGMALSELALIRAVQLAKDHLPPEIAIQIPPNLVSPAGLLACLEAGARDLGGLSPIDEVNPDYDHPTPESLRDAIAPAGWQLRPRLPVYPQYDPWLPTPLRSLVKTWRNSLTNL